MKHSCPPRRSSVLLDKAGFFGQRNEFHRRNLALSRIVPARWRFKAGDCAILQVDKRMKGKLQPSLCQSLSQIAFQIEAMTRLAQHARTVYLQLAALLRQLHRRLRLSQYVLQFLLLMARQRAANGDRKSTRLNSSH